MPWRRLYYSHLLRRAARRVQAAAARRVQAAADKSEQRNLRACCANVLLSDTPTPISFFSFSCPLHS
jgi:hypothetical protein